ncbi:MAG: glycoside hydrolase [Candidatus Eremiobacteraeota bacterium]|nr:glycoside hydrolase [Candidatus Eremiobacteraeota bacterium]
MSLLRVVATTVWLAFAMSALSIPGRAARAESQLYSALHWRSIGPFRAGRTVAVSGVPTQPGVFYMAPNNGGVWKSTDYGRTWNPLFDAQNTGSIGALGVAPSDPNIVYVGSGEGLRRPDLSTGDGMYKSSDGGKTWLHLGLRDGQQIQQIAVDPRDASRLFVAVVGHPYGPNAERGLYRSIDGGASFTKVLGKGGDVGAVSVVIDPRDSKTLYAALWSSRNGPWNLTQVYERFDESGLFKSIDGGTTWHELAGGLPKAVGRIGISVSPADSKRVYAVVEKVEGCGIYRSSDAGATWKETSSEERVCGRTEDFAGITADPKERDTVYSANTTTYRSRDGGKSWTGIKGAPGGDDYHTVWIDPTNPNVIILGSDQGATISVNGGETWSSWYNQPTAQFYHVITDDRFPYRVYGGQQESGSAKVTSRGNDGAITFREFHPVGTEEYGYVAPDPLHPWLIYGGKSTVYDERTGQTQDVSPTYDRTTYRFDRTNPLVWNRVDKHILYLGLNVIFATRDGGRSWRIISPDLTRPNPGQPATLEHFAASDPLRGKHRGVVYSISPSYIDKDVVWAGTDDGLVWRTPDGGKHWKDVTPPALGPWSRVTQIDASHFDPRTAYVSVSRQRLDDARPYLYRTHDGGKTWSAIATGIPVDEPANTIREDPKRRGLLFAGTEKTVYFSTNDGDFWQSLRNDLPITSIRDLVVHGDDVVVGTHGRSFWILDDIAPLREGAAGLRGASAHLFAPARAYRVRRNSNTDTPLPPEEPAGQNPPDGAIIDYWLGPGAAGPVVLEIDDASGRRVRSFSSNDFAGRIDPQIDVPTYWLQPPHLLSAAPGAHRFVWNLRYPGPQSPISAYPISAIVHDTPRSPEGVLALPGAYVVRLIAGGRSYARTLHVAMDPRVTATPGDLRKQYRLASAVADAIDRADRAARDARARKDDNAVKAFSRIETGLVQLLDVVDGADAAPTRQAREAVAMLVRGLDRGGPAKFDFPRGEP